MHTESDPSFEGRGIGSQFVAAMLDDIRRRETKVLAVCPFVRSFLQRHPMYAGRLLVLRRLPEWDGPPDSPHVLRESPRSAAT